MFRWGTQFRGYRIRARDGEIGEAQDMLFDDGSWVIRYLVADTGDSLSGRPILLAPASLHPPDRTAGAFRVDLTKEQIENSPPIGKDKLPSWRQELDLAEHFGWPVYWGEPLGFGSPRLITAEGADVSVAEEPAVWKSGIYDEAVDAHLRSMRELCGYRVQATDRQIGYVEDFIVQHKDWIVPYLVVDARKLGAGRRVLLASSRIDRIRSGKSNVCFNLDSGLIKTGPQYDPSQSVDGDYERRLCDHYGRDVQRKRSRRPSHANGDRSRPRAVDTNTQHSRRNREQCGTTRALKQGLQASGGPPTPG